MTILDMLFENADEKYADFQSKLIPNISSGTVIGVRMPQIRQIANNIYDTDLCDTFMNSLPHKYYDENMLHSALLTKIKDYNECIASVEKFLPYIDNWAVCDTLRPLVFKKNKDYFFPYVKKWIQSKDVYTCRFGIGMLMCHFLDDSFKAEYLELPSTVLTDEYYVNMMISWYYATALAKQWDDSIIYIEDNRLSPWIHNKTIQKSCESFRISTDHKNYLKSLRK